MTLEAFVARPLMALAAALTPAARADWSLAMRQEFDALPDGQGAMGWAAGCVGAALGWRIRAEMAFILTATATALIGWWISTRIFFFLVDSLHSKSAAWMQPMEVAQNVLQGGVCFILAFAWPRRAALPAVAVPMTWGFGGTFQFLMIVLGSALADPWSGEHNNPAVPTILFVPMFLVDVLWASALGAALGWGLSHLWRRFRSGPVAA